jgi:hypothetical protein
MVARGDEESKEEVFVEEEEGGGDQFMAVKPWLGAIVEPTKPPVLRPEAPAVDVRLDWVYGYRGGVRARAPGRKDACMRVPLTFCVYAGIARKCAVQRRWRDRVPRCSRRDHLQQARALPKVPSRAHRRHFVPRRRCDRESCRNWPTWQEPVHPRVGLCIGDAPVPASSAAQAEHTGSCVQWRRQANRVYWRR